MQETIENIEIKSGKCGFIHSAIIHQGDELFSVEQSRGIIFNFVDTPRNFIIAIISQVCDNKITWCIYKVKYNIFSPCKLSRN